MYDKRQGTEEFKQYRQINTSLGKATTKSVISLELGKYGLDLYLGKQSACPACGCWHKHSGHGIWHYFGPSKVLALPLKL